MSRAAWIAGVMCLSGVAWSGGAQAATFTDTYLHGRWTTGSTDNCTMTMETMTRTAIGSRAANRQTLSRIQSWKQR